MCVGACNLCLQLQCRMFLSRPHPPPLPPIPLTSFLSAPAFPLTQEASPCSGFNVMCEFCLLWSSGDIRSGAGLPWGLSGKESTCQCMRRGFGPWSGKIPGEGNDYPLQYSSLENSMDRGAWWATVHGVVKESDKTEQLNDLSTL